MNKEGDNLICVIECDNTEFRNIGSGLSLFKFKPGHKYLYRHRDDRVYNYLYRNGSDYHGYVSREFIKRNFVPEMEYFKLVEEIDSLFENNLYNGC